MSLINTPNFRNPNAERHLNVVMAFEFNEWARDNGSSLRLYVDERKYAKQHVLNFRNKDKYSSSLPPLQLEKDFDDHVRNFLKLNVELEFIATNPLSSMEGYGLAVKEIQRETYQSFDELCAKHPGVGMDNRNVCGYGDYTVIRNGWIMGTTWVNDGDYPAMTRETVHLGCMTNRYNCTSGLFALSTGSDDWVIEGVMHGNPRLRVGNIIAATLPDVFVENLLLNYQTRRTEENDQAT